MGYILPVQQFTYTDYQRRTQPEKVNPYTIHGPQPLFMKKNAQSPFDYEHFKKHGLNNKDEKGQYINTYV